MPRVSWRNTQGGGALADVRYIEPEGKGHKVLKLTRAQQRERYLDAAIWCVQRARELADKAVTYRSRAVAAAAGGDRLGAKRLTDHADIKEEQARELLARAAKYRRKGQRLGVTSLSFTR